jgi:uncharacterized protein YcbK (DUF882 family)
MEKTINWKQYAPEFQSHEFTCRCGCKLNNMHDDFMRKLSKARKIANIPFNITSGCRCASHNRKEGGSISSDHLTGRGVDIRVTNSKHRWIIINALLEVGFNRVGIAKTFIHAGDETRNTSEVMWMY